MSILNKKEETIISTIILAIIIIFIISNFTKIKTLKMLLYTGLGRLLLLMMLVYVTSCNKILGLLFVLFIILLDSSLENNLYYMENFESSIKNMIGNGENIGMNQNQNLDKNSESNLNNIGKTQNIPLEGRDLVGLERNLQKGKQSNSLTVHPTVYESEEVSPNEPDYGFKSASSLFSKE